MAAHGIGRVALRTIALLAALLAVGGTAQAGDRWGGSLIATTDYIYRGLSLSGGDPAIQAGLHARLGAGWAIGAWASTVNLNRGPGGTYEIDLYLMRSWSLAPDWDMRFGLTHYAFPNDRETLDYDYDEVLASISYKRRLTATVAWSPNTSRYGHKQSVKNKQATSYEATYLQPIMGPWSLAAGAGYYDLSYLFDAGYWYWNAGIVYSMGPIQFDVSRIGAEKTAADLFSYRTAGRRWSAALSWRF